MPKSEFADFEVCAGLFAKAGQSGNLGRGPRCVDTASRRESETWLAQPPMTLFTVAFRDLSRLPLQAETFWHQEALRQLEEALYQQRQQRRGNRALQDARSLVLVKAGGGHVAKTYRDYDCDHR